MTTFRTNIASFKQAEISSSLSVSGSVSITGSLDIEGGITLKEALQLNPSTDPGGSNTSASFLFVTTSADNTENNLHYRNNGALWEMHWLEERTDTGLIWGGITTFSGSLLYVTPGAGLIVNHNANTSSHGDTTPTYVTFGPITASATFITSSQVTYLLIDSDGTLLQQTTPFTPQQYNEKFPLGYIFCLTTSSISSFADARVTTYGQDEQQSQFIRAFGPLKISGYDITPQSGSLKYSVASGRAYRIGGFYVEDPNNPSTYDSPTVATGSIVRIYRDPNVIGGFKAQTNNGFPYTDIDPTKWDNGSGTLQTVSASQWTIQRVFQGVVNNISYVYYGQNTYDSLNAAIQSITTEAFEESTTSIIALPFIGYIIVKGDTTNLNDSTNNKIINSGLFRNTAGSSGGGSVSTINLNDLADVNIISPTTGQALVYNAGNWENNTPLNATSASYATTASYTPNALITASVLSNTITFTKGDTTTFNLTVNTGSAASTPPGGLNTQIQFNSGSTFSGSAAFTYNYISQSLQQGNIVVASGQFSHAEGEQTIASGFASHAEGAYTTASGDYSHAEGRETIASGFQSHAEGYGNKALGDYSHGEGFFTVALGLGSHAEGRNTLADGRQSHSEGNLTTASGWYSHAEGYNTQATANYTHAGGMGTIASGVGQTTVGNYNISTNDTSLFVVGAGTADNDRKDAFTVEPSGLGIFTSGLTVTGSVNATSFTGSLLGTASYATTASSTVDSKYTLQFHTYANANFTWADATIYYMGGMMLTATFNNQGRNPVRVPKAGTIKAAYVSWTFSTAGSNENWSMDIWVNNTSATTIQTLSANTSPRVWSNTALSVAVSAGDYIEIRSNAVTWATNPVSNAGYGGTAVIYIE